MPDLALTRLDHLTVLDARGADVLGFLQGQVSHDVLLLPTRGRLLAALHNPQGRVVAVLRLLYIADDHVLIVLPADLGATVQQLLSRYVLRAKVRISETGTTWRLYGITGPDAALAASTRLHVAMDAMGWRQLIIAPHGEPAPEGESTPADSWHLADIEAGLPQIVAATSGAFVAQMLNLDLLDAISLTKGCYTGQEVVARAHYRGQVKRRMQRFFTASPVPLAAGDRVVLDDGRRVQIVMAAAAEDDGQQFLAVAPLTTAGEENGEPASAPLLESLPLPLPYALPVKVLSA